MNNRSPSSFPHLPALFGLFPLFHEVLLLSSLFIILVKNAREKMHDMKKYFKPVLSRLRGAGSL
jgi:hypothetical protein